MLGYLPVKHILLATAFSAMPARKITKLKINMCNSTVF